MKILIVIAAFLGFAGICPAESLRLEVTVSSIVSPKHAIEVTVDQGTLRIKQGENEPVIYRPNPQETKLLHAAILAVPPKDWDGFWASLNYLDGYLLGARLEHDGKERKFGGINGCPKGFAAILKRIDEITKTDLFGDHWEEMEDSAKKYKSFHSRPTDWARRALSLDFARL
jgi:uncharacterized membrane protein YtjA (UPF0391 family)